MSPRPPHAVLTGDVIGSQQLSVAAQAQLPERLRLAARSSELDERFEVFRGDSWQAVSPAPERGVTLALSLACHLRGFHQIRTRIAIGLGAIDTLRRDKLSLSQGEAFVLSGRALGAMPKERNLVIAPSSSLPPATRHLLEATCCLLDAVSASWTAKQAKAVALATSDQPQKELAQQFAPAISPQAFGKHLASAQWKLVSQALQSIEEALRPEGARL